MKPSIIAIDGPAASGKSTLGERLARELGYIYFDTGVMYRAVTWIAIKRGIPIQDEKAITDLARSIYIEVTPPTVQDGRQCSVFVDGEDVTWDIRRPEVDKAVSPVSAYIGVREALTKQQRRIGLKGKIVMVGRDIGTVVLPEADLKIYLDASLEERARRRWKELLARGENISYEEVLEIMRDRDRIDSSRSLAPLRPAEDAFIIDTTSMGIEEVFRKVMEIIGSFSTPPRSLDRRSAIFRRLAIPVLRFLFRLLTRVEVRGQENVPESGPVIIAINHLGHLDAPLVVAFAPREVEGIALADLYSVPVIGLLLRLYGAIPVHRDEFDRNVIRRSLEVMAQGRALALAPEARRSPSKALEKARKGVAYLAMKGQAPVVPTAITGTEDAVEKLLHFKRPRITLTFGKPIYPPPFSRDKAALESFTEKIMREIAAMLPPQYRGYYS